MKLTKSGKCERLAGYAMALAAGLALGLAAVAQGVSTTTVQGTVYLANGQPGAGTMVVSWPSFTTAAGQAIAADQLTVTIPADGFVSVNLAPNQGATPAGEYYTVVFYMSDGSTNTEYWVVPGGTQATIAQVRAQVMPAAQALQAVNKAYVDQSIAELTESLLTASGGNLSGPLYLNGDPSQPLQAADKHYVDTQVATAVPLSGGSMTGALILSADPTQTMQAADKEYVDATAASAWPGMVLRADQFAGADFGAKLQACVNAVSASYGGTCDARNFTGNQTLSANLTLSNANTTVLLPCAAISTASQIVVTAGTRNVALRGCALRGGSAASGSQGGTALAYSGAGAAIQVGDPAYAVDTPGFHLDNVVINTTQATSAAAQGLAAYRTQELDVESVYFLGNANQTGMTLDGTGNYTGGTFFDDQFSGFQTAVNAIGHQVANPATTDWMNASSFVRLHIDCPTSSGNPIAGTYGINLQQGDGNTFTGGDVEGCATALHLGANAQNNTIVGLRNENSTNQVIADAGSAYNNWITGGTMFTGKLADSGTHNSFWDAFHRSFNTLNGDLWRSQADATVTDHVYTGLGLGNVRGRLTEYQTDVPGSPGNYQNAWLEGISDGTTGEQFYQINDLLNNVPRVSIGQYNNASSTNNQTVINSAGTGAVVLNGSNNSGTGGVVIGSGGASETTVATIGNTGNAQFNGTLQVGGTAQFTGTPTVRNNADAEVDYYLWPGLTTSQKGSFTYKDWNGNSQWYMVKDASNNWALNSAIGGLDSFKAYQSSNSGDTYINASNTAGVVRVNYESGSGSAFKVYGGGSGTVYASFTGASSIAFPGLAAGSGHNCLQIDTSGYVTNTGSACGSGSGDGGTVSSSSSGYIAYYTGNGSSIGGMSTVPVTAGGTGTTTAAAALANLGGLPLAGGTLTGALYGTSAGFSGAVQNSTTESSAPPVLDIRNTAFAGGAVCNGTTGVSIDAAVQAAYNALPSNGGTILIVGNPNYCYWADPAGFTWVGNKRVTFLVQGTVLLGDTLQLPIENTVVIGSDGGGEPGSFGLPAPYAKIQGPSTTGTLGSFASQGTIAVTNGSPTVVGTGTGWTCTYQASAGVAQMLIAGTWYTVSACNSSTQTITLTTNYTGSTASGLSYFDVGANTTVTPSSMTGIAVNGYVSVAGTTTANISTVTCSNGQVTAQLSGSAAIPPGVPVIIAGVANSAFNGGSLSPGYVYGNFITTYSDYTANTVTWNQSGCSGSSTGGTITGMDETTVEDVAVTATTSTTFTGVFFRRHNTSDSFGIVGIAMGNSPTQAGTFGNGGSEALQNLIVNSSGTAVVDNSYQSLLDKVSVFTEGACHGNSAAFAIDAPQASYVHMSAVNADAYCQPYAIHAYLWGFQYQGGGEGPLTIDQNSSLIGGLQLDYGAGALTTFRDSTCNDCAAAIRFNPNETSWEDEGNIINIENVGSNDNQQGFPQVEFLQTSNLSGFSFYPHVKITGYNGGWEFTTNDYAKQIRADNPLIYGYSTTPGPIGTFDNGKQIDGEIRGEGASMPPSLIPYTTANVAQTGGSGGCTVGSAVAAPDGSLTAYPLTENSGYANSVLSKTITPAVGDVILFGGWVYTPTALKTAIGAGGESFRVDNGSSTHYSFNYHASGYGDVGSFDSQIPNDWWHPSVGEAIVTSSDGTSGQTVNMDITCNTDRTIDYWNPWFIYIPASAGIPLTEINRWKTQLMHGYVPPNLSTAPIMQVDPNNPVYLGLNTADLYADSNGNVKTDQAFSAANGFKVSSNQIVPPTATLPYVGFKTYSGSGTPTDTCSSSANTGAIEINATPVAYQCSNATGSYAWNVLGSAPGGSVTGNGTGGYIPAWTGSSTQNNSHLDDGATTAGTITSTEPLQVSGLPSDCVQYPCVVGSTVQTGLTTASNGTLVSSPTAGMYKVNIVQQLTTTGTGGTISAYAYCQGPQGNTISTSLVAGLNVTSSNQQTQATYTLECSSSSNISWTTSFSSVTGSPVYSIYITVERLH